MLKIKDDVDLKELKKFGFEEISFDYSNNQDLEVSIYIKNIKQINKKKNVRFLKVFIENRIIKLKEIHFGYFINRKKLDKKYIQDLIQAGLVEKIEGENK